MHSPSQIDAGGDVAPLVAGADLQQAAILLVQMHEVIGLQQHVTELGIANAGIVSRQAALDRILGHHHADGKMFADVAQKIEIAATAHPIVVVHQHGRMGLVVEVEHPPHLLFEPGHVGPQDVDRKQVAFFALAAGISDHAGGPADQGDGAMAGTLKTPQHQQRDQAPDVQAVGRRVESAVQRAAFACKPLRQPRVVGRLVNEPALAQVGENIFQACLASATCRRRQTDGPARRASAAAGP